MKIKSARHNPDVLSCLANLSSDEVFTSPKTANEMLDMLPSEIWSNPNVKFLDPATKTGVFLREIFKRLLKGLETKIPNITERVNHICTKQLYGIAITELTGMLSRRAIYCSKTANGEYSVCTGFEDTDGNIYFPKAFHKWKSGTCEYCGATQEIYEREEDLEAHAYGFIHNIREKELMLMEWDVIISNPPYQLSDGGAGSSAKPLYHKFIEQAKNLNPRYISMIIPSRWFAGGKGLDNFRKEMLNDQRIKKMVDYTNAKECFPSNNISGGVSYFLWSRDYKGDCEFSNIHNGVENKAVRKLNEFDIFIRYNDALSIIKKVNNKGEDMMSTMVSSRKPFGLNSYDRGKDQVFTKSLKLYSSAGISYIEESKVLNGKGLIPLHKVAVGKALSGRIGELDKSGKVKVLAKILQLKPGEVSTETYLIAGGFQSEVEASNLDAYLKTKFARFLLLQALTSMNITKDKFCFVPIQDFKKTWDDKDLYQKYDLNEEEIQYIEEMISSFDGLDGEDNVR